MTLAAFHGVFYSGVLGLAVAGAAIAVLSLAQLMELRRSRGPATRLVSLLAVVMAVVLVALLAGRVVALG